MSIVGGLDIHRHQVTFDVADTVTGEAWHGQVRPADREHGRGWLVGLAGRGEVPGRTRFATRCSGWTWPRSRCGGHAAR